MNPLPALAIAVALSAAGCRPSPPRSFSPDEAPPALKPAAARADAAIAELRSKLMPRLLQALQQGGPVRAIEVCSREAPALAASASRDGVRVGRTSHRLRNGNNAPPAWAAPLVAEAAQGRAAARVVDLGDRVGVVQPILTGGMCLACHGDPAPEVARALHAAYPDDRATGFKEGAVRGLFWAEAAK